MVVRDRRRQNPGRRFMWDKTTVVAKANLTSAAKVVTVTKFHKNVTSRSITNVINNCAYYVRSFVKRLATHKTWCVHGRRSL